MKSFLGAVVWLALLGACGAMGADGYPPGDDDDSSADGGPDGDADADADADMDADEAGAVYCDDFFDNDGNGLSDCLDPGCAEQVSCCDTPNDILLDDGFDKGLDLNDWKPFGDGTTAVHDSGLYPTGDDRFESGVVTTRSYPLAGLIDLTFQAILACEPPCQELVGVALTARNDYAESSTVEPLAGLVIDASQEGERRVLLVVNGAVEAEQAIPDNWVNVTLQVRPDRKISVSDSGGLNLSLDSTTALDPSITEAYVAVFGRGGAMGGVEEVKLLVGPCQAPGAVQRAGDEPLLAGGDYNFAPSAIRGASVSGVADGTLLEMLFTAVGPEGTSIGRAVSDDGGLGWDAEPSDTPVLSAAEMPTGTEDPDDPALLVRSAEDRVAAVSVAPTGPAGDASKRSIVILTSADGLSWNLLTDTPLTDDACRSIRHPALVDSPTAGLVLYYTCEQVSGAATIRRATSADQRTWSFAPMAALSPDPDDEGEMDGVASPTVLFDGRIWKLWYEARSGVRRTLRYAASSNGADWTAWQGTVLSPGPAGAWDGLQVGDPSAIMTGPLQVRIFYTGRGPEGQAVGAVTHDLPAF